MGPWPELFAQPEFEQVVVTRRENIPQRQLKIGIGIGGEMVDAFMLIPDGDGPYPAVLVPYYDAQTGIGKGVELRDFGWQLAKRGFVTLSIGKPNSGVNFDNPRDAGPSWTILWQRRQSSPTLSHCQRSRLLLRTRTRFLHPALRYIRIESALWAHSFGGKWSLFAS